MGSFSIGEGLLLEPSEKRRLYEIAVQELGGRVPVIAVSLGYTSTAQVIRAAAEAVSIGVDGVQLYPPRPGPNAARVSKPMLETFYREVCEAVDGPIVLGLQSEYMPEGVFPLELIGKLIVDYTNITGLNCTTRDAEDVAAVAGAFGSRLPVRCAGIDMLLPTLANGGTGYLGPECNFAPTWINKIVTSYRRGHIDASQSTLASVHKVNTVLRRNPVCGEKMAVHVLGSIEPHVRKPYLPPDERMESEIRHVMMETGLFDLERWDGDG